MSKKKQYKFSFIDLFAGIGGFRLACEKQGGECVFSSEWEKNAAAIYAENFGERPAGDITKIKSKDIPYHDLLCAGFPCQAFSGAGQRKGFEDIQGTLIFDVARIIRDVRPKVFLLENVVGLIQHDKGRTFDVIRNLFGKTFNGHTVFFKYDDNLGYDLYYTILNSSDFGVPQKRRRIYIVGFDGKLGITKFKFPKGTTIYPKPCLADIVDSSCEDDELYVTNKILRNFIVSTRKYVSGKNLICGMRDSIGTLLHTCGSKFPILYSGDSAVQLRRSFIYRCNDAELKRTLDYFYCLNKKRVFRRLSIREVSRLQGFPKTYKMRTLEKLNYNVAYGMFGNSVTVNVIDAIVDQIINTLEKNKGESK